MKFKRTHVWGITAACIIIAATAIGVLVSGIDKKPDNEVDNNNAVIISDSIPVDGLYSEGSLKELVENAAEEITYFSIHGIHNL